MRRWGGRDRPPWRSAARSEREPYRRCAPKSKNQEPLVSRCASPTLAPRQSRRLPPRRRNSGFGRRKRLCLWVGRALRARRGRFEARAQSAARGAAGPPQTGGRSKADLRPVRGLERWSGLTSNRWTGVRSGAASRSVGERSASATKRLEPLHPLQSVRNASTGLSSAARIAG